MPIDDADLPSLDTAVLQELTVDRRDAAAQPVTAQLIGLQDARLNRMTLGAAIARGGMGTVRLAEDRLLRQRVAVKVLHRNLEGDPDAVRRFIHEARITARLDHPNIVPVYDIGHLPEEGLYFSMKHVEGRTLSRMVRALPLGGIQSGTLVELLDVVIRVCDALAFAHDRGILHCDLKPANIMVGDFGQVYLMDWGMAREWRTDPLPDDGRIFGTVSYMAPEQARSETIDPRSDVFGIGAILYYIFARKAPFKRKFIEQSLFAAMNSKAPPIGQVAPHCPPRLQAIIARAMAPAPQDRFATATELRDALMRYLRGQMDFPRRDLPAHYQLITEGEYGNSAYILTSGRCEVYRFEGGERKRLRILTSGAVFGETAILAESQRSANVITLEPCRVLEVTREVLEQELSEMTPWMGVLLKTLAQYFHERETRR